MPSHIRTLLFAALICLPTAAIAETPYSPPKIAQGEGGWESYVDPLMIDTNTAAGLNPDPDSPEATVVLFLASRIRGDDAWTKAMTSNPNRKAKKALKKWKGWKLNTAQIQSRKQKGNDRYYVRAWFELVIDGDKETGSDDFTVIREDGGWRISGIPS